MGILFFFFFRGGERSFNDQARGGVAIGTDPNDYTKDTWKCSRTFFFYIFPPSSSFFRLAPWTSCARLEPLQIEPGGGLWWPGLEIATEEKDIKEKVLQLKIFLLSWIESLSVSPYCAGTRRSPLRLTTRTTSSRYPPFVLSTQLFTTTGRSILDQPVHFWKGTGHLHWWHSTGIIIEEFATVAFFFYSSYVDPSQLIREEEENVTGR